MKTLKIVLIAIAAFGPLLVGMAVEPSQFIQRSSISWLVVRGVALCCSIVLALLTYYGTGMAAAYREVKNDIINIRKDAAASNSVPEFLNNISAAAWLFWWIFCFQLMAIFYIADWCPTGF